MQVVEANHLHFGTHFSDLPCARLQTPAMDRRAETQRGKPQIMSFGHINSLVERPLEELPRGFGSSLESLHHWTETSTWRAAIASGQGGIWHV